MAWTPLKTDWTTGELVTAEDMNAVGENLRILRTLESAAYTTLSNINARASFFTDVDSDNLSLTITTTGRDVLVHFHGSVWRSGRNSRDGNGYYDVDVDGIRLGNDNGLLSTMLQEPSKAVSFTHLIQGLGAGSHTFKLQWKNVVNHHTYQNLRAGAHFWVREI